MSAVPEQPPLAAAGDTVRVRPLAAADVAAYRELRLLAVQESPEAFGFSYEDVADVPMDESARQLGLGGAREEGVVMGAFAGERLVATGQLSRERALKERHKAWLHGVYVHPGFRHRRIGERLLRALVEAGSSMPGLRVLKLGVGAENAAARRLYLALGFRTVGMEPLALYVGGRFIDEELMMLDLAAEHSGGTKRQPGGAAPDLAWWYASDADLDLLARWNHELIRDEGHRNTMTAAELATRMRGWLMADYRAVIFRDAEPVAYSVFRYDVGVNIRQFFVRRDRRREGIGRAAFELLRRQVWPEGMRLTVDALCANSAALAFWRSLGFRDYCLTLEIPPEPPGAATGSPQ
jgi:ribosomal protein S18 acetylase RimI-like enzyme